MRNPKFETLGCVCTHKHEFDSTPSSDFALEQTSYAVSLWHTLNSIRNELLHDFFLELLFLLSQILNIEVWLFMYVLPDDEHMDTNDEAVNIL